MDINAVLFVNEESVHNSIYNGESPTTEPPHCSVLSILNMYFKRNGVNEYTKHCYTPELGNIGVAIALYGS